MTPFRYPETCSHCGIRIPRAAARRCPGCRRPFWAPVPPYHPDAGPPKARRGSEPPRPARPEAGR